MKRNKITRLFVLLAALILLLGSISCGKDSLQLTSETTVPEVPVGPPGSGEVSWVKGYTSLSDAVTDSSVIVVGVIDRVSEVIDKGGGLYMTFFVLRLETVLKGEAIGEILVAQTGASGKPETGLKDDPLFQLGERYLLFLTKGTTGRYKYPGPCGRFKITAGEVYSMNYELQNEVYRAPVGIDFNGVGLNIMVNTIADILKTMRFLVPGSTVLLRGEATKLDITLSMGENEGIVNYVLKWFSINGGTQIGMPPGFHVTVEPSQFVASSHTDYSGSIEIATDENKVLPGEYWFIVEYRIGDSINGNKMFRVVIDAKTLSEVMANPR